MYCLLFFNVVVFDVFFTLKPGGSDMPRYLVNLRIQKEEILKHPIEVEAQDKKEAIHHAWLLAMEMDRDKWEHSTSTDVTNPENDVKEI